MPTPSHVLERVRLHALAIFGLRAGPLPVSAMIRSGGAIGMAFGALLVAGRYEAAILAAFFTNFLCLADRAQNVGIRIWVQIVGAVAFSALGALGLVLTGHTAAILLTVFAVALLAGLVHGTSPGIEAVPRFALCCLIVAAYIPLDAHQALLGVMVGTASALLAVVIDIAIRGGQRGDYARLLRAGTVYPGPRFSLAYGCAALCGLLAGLGTGATRPYWVTLTVLLVMQPDRRANFVRSWQRFIGTLAGVVAAFLVVHALPDGARSAGLVGLGMALPFVWPLGFERNYALGVAILSCWVLLLIDTELPSTDLAAQLFLARLSDTTLGCIIALCGSLAVAKVEEAEA